MEVFDELKTSNIKGIYSVASKQNVKNDHTHPAANTNVKKEIKFRRLNKFFYHRSKYFFMSRT